VIIRIYTLYGELVTIYTSENSGGEAFIDVSKLSPGYYIYIIYNPENTDEVKRGKFAIIK
ncbi:MAG: T9SS type A sorting domain-containing protein, partial [Candidatus Goldbacteria bacterium]|nr:T9SS type A sorting domain-containing protein [Candidatus Goldiibacteriota bacterium]